MKLQHTLAMGSLANRQKGSLYVITKKIGYLSLAALFTNSVSAIETSNIKNMPLQCPSVNHHGCPAPTNEAVYTRYSQPTTAPMPMTFDYDPGLLPEVAEVIFVLRIKHANIGKKFIINLSGNYLLRFTENGIYILDTYTKNRDVYQYQSTNPNITIGLGISKGLPRNYKSLTIKEDAHGKLYDYAALRSDNISTDESILSETLSHPFYQITGEDAVENEVKVTKAMAFYQTEPSHGRHARCVKESMSILKQIQDILGSGSLACGPKAGSGILSANHQSVEDMKLDQQLVEATVNKGKYGKLGFRLKAGVDFNKQYAVAYMASSLYCHKSITETIERRRQKRDMSSNKCLPVTIRIVANFISLGLDFMNLMEIIENIMDQGTIPVSLFPHNDYPENSEAVRRVLEHDISEDRGRAIAALQNAAALVGVAAMSDPQLLTSQEGTPLTSTEAVEQSVATARLEQYTLDRQGFRPTSNQVRVLDDNLQPMVVSGEHYSTRVFPLDNEDAATWTRSVSPYLVAILDWITDINEMRQDADEQDRIRLDESMNIMRRIHSYIARVASPRDVPDLVVSAVYHNTANHEDFHEDVLVGINIGEIRERVYHPLFGILAPEYILRREGDYLGALEYLLSQELSTLFSRDQIDSAEVVVLSRYSTNSHDEHSHDEL